MGFMDEVSSGGGTKLLKFDGRAGKYVVRGSEATFNGQEFVVDVYSANGGFLKFKGKGEPPERRMGLVFPKDLAPALTRAIAAVKAGGPAVDVVADPR